MIALHTYLPQLRLLLAFLISPLLVPLAIYVATLMAYGVDAYNTENTLITMVNSIWYTYVLVLIFGAPSLYLLKKKQADTVLYLSLTGAAIGLLSAVLMSILSGSFNEALYFLFGSSGLAFGALFWFIWQYQPKPSSRLKKRQPRRRR